MPTGSPGQLRCQEAIKKATDVLLNSLSEIMTYSFDSWFSWTKVIRAFLHNPPKWGINVMSDYSIELLDDMCTEPQYVAMLC